MGNGTKYGIRITTKFGGKTGDGRTVLMLASAILPLSGISTFGARSLVVAVGLSLVVIESLSTLSGSMLIGVGVPGSWITPSELVCGLSVRFKAKNCD